MTLADVLLNRLKAEQADYALRSLRTPGDKTPFDYGLRVGYVQGLEAAIGFLLQALDDERHGDRDPL